MSSGSCAGVARAKASAASVHATDSVAIMNPAVSGLTPKRRVMSNGPYTVYDTVAVASARTIV